MGHAAEKLEPPSFEDLYQEIRALPEGMTGEILVPGVLQTMSRPGKRHRRAALNCLHALRAFNANVGGTGWWIEVEAEVRLPAGRLVVPDLIGYRVERVPELPDDNPLTLLPDWACEVFSPSTTRIDRFQKLPLYARSGIPWVWLIDIDARAIEVYETVDGRPALTASATEDERVSLPPFNGEIDAAPFWLPLKTEEKED